MRFSGNAFYVDDRTQSAYIAFMENIAALVIEKFGGAGPLAKLLGHRHPTTVQGWLSRGHIPARQQAAVFRAASEAGIALTAEELIGISTDA